MRPATLGELKKQHPVPTRFRSVKDEIRDNLTRRIREGEHLFPGIVGFDETVLPSIVNALLSKHNFILLGLRGQAKSRILRSLIDFLDEEIPVIGGSEINDDPFFPISEVSKRRIAEEGDDLPIEFLLREDRYVEKLATPDVTIADIIGDLDPIKAARHSKNLSAFDNVHFGLLPRAHRGIFAINELPDLAPKIQVALFNIMQEGDVQIKGFPVRLPLDVLLVFSANPEDYTARGKIITPLKDRIGDEIRTHYPLQLEEGLEITAQEAWTRRSQMESDIPSFIRETIEMIAFLGRQDKRIDRRSGVSQRLPITCMETSISNAERRSLGNDEETAILRVSDIFASIPAITGKLELEYEGELKGGETIANELIQGAVLKVFEKYFPEPIFDQLIQWFNLGGQVRVSDETPATDYYEKVKDIQGVDSILEKLSVSPEENLGLAVSAIEFVLEGLHAQRKLSRNKEQGYYREEPQLESDLYERMERGRGSFN